MNFDYLNRVGTAHNNFKTHEMRLNEENQKLKQEIERLNKCIDEALEIIIKDWNNKCNIPIHLVVDTDDIRIKLYYQLFLKGVEKQ